MTSDPIHIQKQLLCFVIGVPGYLQLRDHIPIPDSAKPEDDSLQLPSEFSETQRDDLGLTSLAAIEYDLREGQARDANKTFNYNIAFKKTNVFGQRANTRARSFLQSLSKAAAYKYRRAHAALLKLGLPSDDLVFQSLHDVQLYGQLAVRKGYQRSRKSIGVRIWFRERANRDCHQEEAEILEADFERTVLSYSCMAEIWTEMAERCTQQLGAAAYARKKAVMYRDFANDVSKVYADAKEEADKADMKARQP
ncbi:hypothetical protein PILCRDRAFT_87392 [Piloderma croceum F 1598]|uniref:Uncharacterized protein n=1 Tax=Piloderma croceum (strain F 1598) TaxID=765440 RepID=A0A0C3BDQ8_PILCF|nr:hypothetical protein PILCRDRAFT_87392 [Piloderma croceum F 1598]